MPTLGRQIPTSVRTIKAGAEDFLTKPVTKERLLDTIKRALDHADQLRADVPRHAQRIPGSRPGIALS